MIIDFPRLSCEAATKNILPGRRNPRSYPIDPFLGGKSQWWQLLTTFRRWFPISCRPAQTHTQPSCKGMTVGANTSWWVLLAPLPIHQTGNWRTLALFSVAVLRKPVIKRFKMWQILCKLNPAKSPSICNTLHLWDNLDFYWFSRLLRCKSITPLQEPIKWSFHLPYKPLHGVKPRIDL